MHELLPSFYADVTLPQPAATVLEPTPGTPVPPAWQPARLVARAWRESAAAPCVHLAAANPHATPLHFVLQALRATRRPPTATHPIHLPHSHTTTTQYQRTLGARSCLG